MKAVLIFLFVLLAICCHGQTRDTVFYSSAEEAAKGFTKVPTRYRDQSGRKMPVVRDQSGNVFAIYATCERGFYRVHLNPEAVAAAD